VYDLIRRLWRGKRFEQEQIDLYRDLQESEQRLRLALEAGGMGIWEWRITTGEVVWSPSLEAIHGLAPGTFGGTFEAYQKDIHPDDREHVLRAISETLEQGREHRIEYRILLPSGDTRWVEGRGNISRHESGTPIRMIGVCTDVTDRKESEEKLKLVARELEHRTNNILARVKAIIRLVRADSVPDLMQAIDRRIDALTRTHSLLSNNRWQGAELKRLIGDELAPYSSGADGRVQIVGPPFMLAVPGAESFGMVMHELTTNAVKYGALSRAGGRLRIEWSQPKRNEFVLNWIESGVPLDGAPERKGFGTRVITTIVEQSLSGTVEFGWQGDGLHCRIALLAEKLRQDL
jgi:PAS domain S-box-containing protein